MDSVPTYRLYRLSDESVKIELPSARDAAVVLLIGLGYEVTSLATPDQITEWRALFAGTTTLDWVLFTPGLSLNASFLVEGIEDIPPYRRPREMQLHFLRELDRAKRMSSLMDDAHFLHTAYALQSPQRHPRGLRLNPFYLWHYLRQQWRWRRGFRHYQRSVDR